MKTVKTTSKKVAPKATKLNSKVKAEVKNNVKKAVAKKKKQSKPNSNVVFNNVFKQATRSLKGIEKYIRKEPTIKAAFQKHIDTVNKKYGTNVNFGDATNSSKVKALMTERELFKNANKDKTVLNDKGTKLFIKGDAKQYFTAWSFALCVGRAAKAEKAARLK